MSRGPDRSQPLNTLSVILYRYNPRAWTAWAKASQILANSCATSRGNDVRGYNPYLPHLVCLLYVLTRLFFLCFFLSFHSRTFTHSIGCIVVLTGVTDWVSDGNNIVRLSNGHPLLGEITGSGCMVGTSVATFCGGASLAEAAKRTADSPEDGRLARGDMLAAAVGG